MSAAETPNLRLGRFVASCRERPFSDAVRDKAAVVMLDALGLGISARAERTTAAMLALATPDSGATPAARLWGNGRRSVLSEVVAANAVAAHGHFQDDSDYSSWTHPGSLIVPVAVSLAEAVGASLERALRAVIAGYSTLVWLGAGERVARALIARGVRTSPTLGTIGAAAAASVLLDLDAGRATHAVSIAASMTGGVLEPVRVGSDEWRVQNAQAARGGLLAAQLAAHSVQGAASSLDGPKGLMRSLAGLDAVPEWAQDPDPAGMLTNVVAKPYATLGDNMAAAIAAKLLHDDGVDTGRIRRITTRIWGPYSEYPGTSYRGPFHQTAQALASTVFATAATLVCGELVYSISETRRNDPLILSLADLTTIEAIPGGGPEDATVDIEFEDGSHRSRSANEAPRTLLYHDQPTAIALFERRLAGLGWPAGQGGEVARQVFESMRKGGGTGIRTLLDGVFPG